MYVYMRTVSSDDGSDIQRVFISDIHCLRHVLINGIKNIWYMQDRRQKLLALLGFLAGPLHTHRPELILL